MYSKRFKNGSPRPLYRPLLGRRSRSRAVLQILLPCGPLLHEVDTIAKHARQVNTILSLQDPGQLLLPPVYYLATDRGCRIGSRENLFIETNITKLHRSAMSHHNTFNPLLKAPVIFHLTPSVYAQNTGTGPETTIRLEPLPIKCLDGGRLLRGEGALLGKLGIDTTGERSLQRVLLTIGTTIVERKV